MYRNKLQQKAGELEWFTRKLWMGSFTNNYGYLNLYIMPVSKMLVFNIPPPA